MPTNVPGYTGVNVDAASSSRTGILSGITLTSGDRTLTREEAVNGVLVVSAGHITNAIVLSTEDAAEFSANGTSTIMYVIRNDDPALLASIKVNGGLGLQIGALKTAIVMLSPAGNIFFRVTADVSS